MVCERIPRNTRRGPARQYANKRKNSKTRPRPLGMSDPIWGPLIHIFVDEKKNCEG